MANKILVKFINEGRKKGFSDLLLRKEMLKKRWPISEIEKALAEKMSKSTLKNQICLFLSDDIINILQKRAKKNMFTLSEQIEDILRRSTIRKKTIPKHGKIDDTLLSYFSRARRK